MTNRLPPVIIGAGPAGLSCAALLVAAGLRPIVLDEALHPGGQGTRRLAVGMRQQAARLYGRKAVRKACKREAAEDAVIAACDWRPGHLVWGIFAGHVEVIHDGFHESIPYSQLLIATGATDRIIALPGWTLPGVFTLGGAQVALKNHAAFIGKKIVMAGASPLLYLAAAQYARLGMRDITLVDTSPVGTKWRAAIGMLLASPATTWEGLRLLAELRWKKIRVIRGASLVRANGADHICAVDIRHADGTAETLACDALAFGYGLRPETQLAELAGADFLFDEGHRNWFPVTDEDGRARDDLWLVGDGAMTGGRIAAAIGGQLAAISMLTALGDIAIVDRKMAPRLRRKLTRYHVFQRHLAKILPWPHDAAADLCDDVIVCRCERITAGEIRGAIRQPAGPTDVNRVKAVTRCGMGRCQGRFCGQTLQELTAATAKRDVAHVGRLRAQAPVRPIPLLAARAPSAVS